MSSAILYLAIIAIWACVLIPRWLRRDSARGSSHVQEPAVPERGGAVSGGAVSGGDASRVTAGMAGAMAGRVAVEVRRDSAARVAEADSDAGPYSDANSESDSDSDSDSDSESAEQESAPPPLTPQESRQRMLAARRRLLGMLIALEGAAITLAVLKLAALWVVIPPSVMITGYLLLLREAAHADAERTRREQEAARARDRARAQARARARALASQRAAAPAASAGAASSAARYEDAGPGRDFAPGLAGKYTTSNAEVIPIPEREDEDAYDQYTQNKLRAVGD